MTKGTTLIGKLADKIIFGTALIIALQVPQLADHYQQFLSGLYESTKWQVDGYEATAKEHEYPDLRAMIAHHLENDDASVRTDAAQKLYTLELYDQLTNGVIIFNEGNLLDKAIYMFNPSRYGNLEKTVSNFKLGIPLTLNGIAFGVIVALLLNYLITLPFILWTRRKNHL
ncbi:hypothetical protein GCM10008107_30450 [Psychrosphaera saromensis]|nr:hypothetical protein GCM10008107_30450 [Psychrosphaera saromensis]GLQ14661.1 hypothetical protein GCM10007917_21160 [Psychrosphaera saromensis]